MFVAIGASQCGPARAQEPNASLTLAIACVAEIGLEGRVDECLLMWSILRAKGGDEGLVISAIAYNTLLRRNDRSGARAWVLNLTADGNEPAGWPSTLRWENWRDRWALKLAAARRFVASPPKHPCPRATQYGGRCDDARHACDVVPKSWVRELCGQPLDYYAQAYWSIGARTIDVAAMRGGGK
jgi:hypothetical protein